MLYAVKFLLFSILNSISGQLQILRSLGRFHDGANSGSLQSPAVSQTPPLLEILSKNKDSSHFAPENVNHAHKLTGFSWPMGVIPYIIDGQIYDNNTENRIFKAMMTIEAVSCLMFRKLDKKPEDYVGSWLNFSNPHHQTECQHGFGRVGSSIEVVLGFNCLRPEDILHSLLHALGFRDEVTHPQRDRYISIMWDNIQPKYRHLFLISKGDAAYELLEYDSESIMQFPDRTLSNNGEPTIVSVVPGRQISTTTRLSKLDIFKLNLAFTHECEKRNYDYLFKTSKYVFLSHYKNDNEVRNAMDQRRKEIETVRVKRQASWGGDWSSDARNIFHNRRTRVKPKKRKGSKNRRHITAIYSEPQLSSSDDLNGESTCAESGKSSNDCDSIGDDAEKSGNNNSDSDKNSKEEGYINIGIGKNGENDKNDKGYKSGSKSGEDNKKENGNKKDRKNEEGDTKHEDGNNGDKSGEDNNNHENGNNGKTSENDDKKDKRGGSKSIEDDKKGKRGKDGNISVKNDNRGKHGKAGNKSEEDVGKDKITKKGNKSGEDNKKHGGGKNDNESREDDKKSKRGKSDKKNGEGYKRDKRGRGSSKSGKDDKKDQRGKGGNKSGEDDKKDKRGKGGSKSIEDDKKGKRGKDGNKSVKDDNRGKHGKAGNKSEEDVGKDKITKKGGEDNKKHGGGKNDNESREDDKKSKRGKSNKKNGEGYKRDKRGRGSSKSGKDDKKGQRGKGGNKSGEDDKKDEDSKVIKAVDIVQRSTENHSDHHQMIILVETLVPKAVKARNRGKGRNKSGEDDKNDEDSKKGDSKSGEDNIKDGGGEKDNGGRDWSGGSGGGSSGEVWDSGRGWGGYNRGNWGGGWGGAKSGSWKGYWGG